MSKLILELICIAAAILFIVACPALLLVAVAIGMVCSALMGTSTGTRGGEPRDGDV